jgi:heptose-I-phosphate ethanolaminephosphotransferase
MIQAPMMNARALALWFNATMVLVAPVFLALATGTSSALAAASCLAISLASAGVLIILTRTWGAFFLAYAPLLLVSPVYAWYAAAFGQFPDDNALVVALTSSTEEISAFLTMMRLWPPIAICGLAFILYCAAALYLAKVAMPGWLRRGAMLTSIPIVCSAVLLPTSGTAKRYAADIADRMQLYLSNTYPFGGVVTLVVGGIGAAKTMGYAVNKVPYDASIARPDALSDTHILVIGESARYDAFHINGYARPTSPHLEALPGLVSYHAAFTPANLTSFAVPMLMTGIDPERYRPDRIHGSIVDAAREAGYQTAWLSNQEVQVAQIFSPRVDSWHLAADLERSGPDRTRPDEVLLPLLWQELEKPAQRKFSVVHAYGSHWDYAKRLPNGAFQFSSLSREGSRGFFGGGRPEQERHDIYDDTIAYTDWFLAQIVAQLKTQSGRATVTYVSDHGESFGYIDGISGHGLPRFSLAEAQVPLFFWANATFISDRQDQWQNIIARRDALFRTEWLFDTLGSMLGLTFHELNPYHDLTSSNYRAPATIAELMLLAGGKLVPLTNAVNWNAGAIPAKAVKQQLADIARTAQQIPQRSLVDGRQGDAPQ